MKIARHTVASIEYRLTDDAGDEIDSSKGHGPLSYVHGTDSIVPGLESELEGKEPGDELEVHVPPERGYGTRDESLVHSVPRTQFPPGDIEVGMQVEARSKEGHMRFTVVGVETDTVRLDANHPLAGLTLHFAIKVVEVRPATPEELSHGHVHGPGGHHH